MRGPQYRGMCEPSLASQISVNSDHHLDVRIEIVVAGADHEPGSRVAEEACVGHRQRATRAQDDRSQWGETSRSVGAMSRRGGEPGAASHFMQSSQISGSPQDVPLASASEMRGQMVSNHAV